MASKFSCLSLAQLRTELRGRNAMLAGRKKELIERQESYKRINNFNQPEDFLSEFRMNVPAALSYKDVNSDMKMAQIDVDKAKEYMDGFGDGFDDKVVDLYDEHFLLYLRLSLIDKFDFVHSACRAEMKKKITYHVDISLRKNGFVNQAQCECGAGEGPTGHCKHIRTILLACCKFIKSFELKVESPCTEKLQSFHKAKKHTGTPLKARFLNVAGAGSVCDFQDFDPRPEHLRNKPGYNDYFRNVCLNFKEISETPIFQVFKPGSIRALNVDHDYFKETHEQKFLRDNKLVTITDSEIWAIELLTRGQIQNQRWFEEREKRIQSSNFIESVLRHLKRTRTP